MKKSIVRVLIIMILMNIIFVNFSMAVNFADADAFIDKGVENNKISNLSDIGAEFTSIGNVLKYIGAGIIVGATAYMGILYMISPPERQAKLKEQLIADLKGVRNIENLIIAYEPVWCIGTGIIPKNEDIETAISTIKTIISEKFNQNVKVIYGGSIDEGNINTLNNISNVDGFLIGKSSTDYNRLKKIVDILNRQN